MGTQTDEFYAALRRSHTSFSYVEVVSPDLEIIQLKAIDGEVSVDRSAAVRRHLTVRCIDHTGNLTPRATGEILTPYGTELRAYRGIKWQNNDGTWSQEICQLGVFRLAGASVSDGVNGASEISLDAFDRSWVVARDKFTVPYTIAAGTNILTAIKEIIKRTFPDAEYDAISTTLVTSAPLLFDANADPWAAVVQLARSMGCEIYFNVEGRIVIAPPHDINALPAPDFTYIEGDKNSMLDLSRVYSAENVFNGVIVTGESPGDEKPPVRGEAWDMVPSSPTYRFGDYGEVPAFITDNAAKTAEECEKIAKAQLALILGASAQISITAVVNPSYEAGDTVAVKRRRSGVDGLYIVDAFNVPLSSSATQRLAMRERRAA